MIQYKRLNPIIHVILQHILYIGRKERPINGYQESKASLVQPSRRRLAMSFKESFSQKQSNINGQKNKLRLQNNMNVYCLWKIGLPDGNMQ